VRYARKDDAILFYHGGKLIHAGALVDETTAKLSPELFEAAKAPRKAVPAAPPQEAPVDDAWEEPEVVMEEPELEPEPEPKAAFPIEGYDKKTAYDVIAIVEGTPFSFAQLDRIREHELATKKRKTVLAALEEAAGD
jgi:hypothetical protein